MSNPAPNIKEQLQKLDAQVDWFYSDQFQLDQAVEKYKQALATARAIEQDLKQLQNKITKIEADFSRLNP